MKRILMAGAVGVVVSVCLTGCAEKPTTSPKPPLSAEEAAEQSALNNKFQEQYAGAKILVLTGCVAKLDLEKANHPEDLAVVRKCTQEQLAVMGKSLLARVEAGEISQGDMGGIALDQAVVFVQAHVESARTGDPQELKKAAVEGGRKLLQSDPK